MPQCAFKSCKNNARKSNLTNGVSYFRFPSDPYHSAEWIAIVAQERREKLYRPYKNSTICSIHFDKFDITGKSQRRRLVKTAIPKLQRSADSRAEDAESDSSNLTSGARGAGIDSSGEYSDFDDEQAEATSDDVTSGEPTQEYQIEVDQNEVNYDVCKVETVEHTFDEEDRGTFVPATEHNMPEVNMFAVVEYICKHARGLKRLDYPKWKLLTKNNPNLISAIKVARTDDMCRLRATVNFDRVNSHMCEVEYVVHTDTISSSECVCGNNPCEHVAAFLMWLAHKPTTNNTESEQVHTSGERDGPLLNELQQSDSLVEDIKPSVSDDVRTSTSRSDSNMEVVPQPPVKRQRIASEVDVPVVSESLITVVPLPKDENEPDKSKIECTFRRQIVFDLWKSTTGSSSDCSDKFQATLKQQLQDDDYIIDFSPIKQRIEQLCLVFDIMKNEIDKSIFTEFMNTKEFIELERQARKKNSSLRDPLS